MSRKIQDSIENQNTEMETSSLPALLMSLIGTKQTKSTITEYRIPQKWPVPQKQRGPNCGIYALSTLLNYIGENNIPARKDGKAGISLRQIAKKTGVTTYGAIYRVEGFKIITDYLKVADCKAEIVTQSYRYTEIIKDYLKNGHFVIAPCDIDLKTGLPSSQSGYTTHWALIFGYFVQKSKLKFLVTQHGKYYVWSAVSLQKSNEQLPLENPRGGVKYYAYKWGKDSYTFGETCALTQGEDIESLLHAKEESLTRFRFSLFTVKIPNVKNLVPAPLQPVTAKL